MTIQVSNSDSGLFRFIHDCGNPVHAKSLQDPQVSVFYAVKRFRTSYIHIFMYTPHVTWTSFEQ